MNTRPNLIVPRNGGHTLIELMIAILIGLILVLAAFQVLATFEGHKRTTTAMDDALQSANFGLYQMDLLTRSAGTGVVQARTYAYGCPLNYTDAHGDTITDGDLGSNLPGIFNTVLSSVPVTLRLAPAVIFPGADATKTDFLLLMSGGSGFGETPVKFSAAASGTQLDLANTIGFFPDEWVLVSSNAVLPATATSCMVTKVTSTYTAETAANSTGNVALPLTQSAVGAASLATFAANGVVAGLGVGNNASFTMYGVDTASDTLMSVDLLNADFNGAASPAQFVSDDVVMLHAVYGTNPSAGTLAWVQPTGDYAPASLLAGTAAANTLLTTIKAIRIGVLVRAPLNEQADANRSLETGNVFSENTYTFFSSLPAGAQYTWTVPTDQRNFRYRVLEATIPLRNASLF